MKLDELKIDVFKDSSPEVFMRILHIQTGLSVEGSGRGQYKLRQLLIAELENKLNQLNTP